MSLRWCEELLQRRTYLFLCGLRNALNSTQGRGGESSTIPTIYFPWQARYEEAETFFERSRVVREKVLGPLHPDVAQSWNNRAELLRQQVGAECTVSEIDQAGQIHVFPRSWCSTTLLSRNPQG